MPNGDLGLLLCTPFHVANLWHWVEHGISETLRKCKDEFTPKDVYWYLRDNRATMFLLFEDRELAGFVVVEVSVHQITGSRTFCVWLLHFHGGKTHGLELQERLERLAKQVNCSAIEFKSPLTGWTRAAKWYGYKPKIVTWRKDVDGTSGY